jgi:hypothetical protein
MGMSMLSNKRGESLVEVIVSLGIFAFVFMGVMNIVIGSITLNTTSGQRTEAVAKTQKKLNVYLAQYGNNGVCTVGTRSDGIVANTLEGSSSDCNIDGSLTDSSMTCYWVKVEPLVGEETKDSGGNPIAGIENFVKVTSYGKWYAKLQGEETFSVSRMVEN